MSSPDKVIALDVAIIGGGSAGMALAARLEQVSAVVFEPKTPAERDCSWALWARPEQLQALSPAVTGRWDRWRLIDDCGEVIHHSGEFCYTSLSAERYLQHCEDSLNDSVSLVRAPVESLIPEQGGGQINAAGQAYTASTIYDSRPPKSADNSLCQHFIGWEIITTEPIDNVDIATLMDFRVDQSRGLHFIYVLPYSDRHLLVESTMISNQPEEKDWYRHAISQWLADRNIQIQSQLREEYGVISMAAVKPPTTTIAQIGAAGGSVRLSSGYAFSTIQTQMAALADTISAGERKVPAAFSRRLVFMDKVFNRALNARPDHGVTVFMAMAKSLNGEQFARFMLGHAGLGEWAKVIMAMPKWPFIVAALRQVFSHD